jgi:hypothetical protein
MPNPACVAYEAYRTHLMDNVGNTNLLPWECLSECERDAWWKVVRALVELTSKENR